jgi:hypothetical protein
MKATYLLAGLRFAKETVKALFEGVRTMDLLQESSSYQLILEEGGIKEARKIVLRLGRIRFGTPDEMTRETIEAIDDLDRLERLSERLLTASSWAELLAER